MQDFSQLPFYGDPSTMMRNVGPPTKPQPEWSGVGFKTFHFDYNPVGHIIASDNSQHAVLNVWAERAHLPVEGRLLDYITETGYNPSIFNVPPSREHWDVQSEQFGYPDSRPAAFGQQMPKQELKPSPKPQRGFWQKMFGR